uniref:Myosin motor domain-containing protein n=1 Tax=Globodera pallida TaxID=36090 RepID=A0A183CCA5_GLOPA
MDLHSIPAHSPEMASDEELRLLGEDLVRLCLNDPRTIFDSVCARYERKKRLYTRIGASDLLALNLHEHLSIFEPSVFAQFLPPKAPSDHSGAHIFATASQTLKDVSGDGKEAAIVFCGEAGAGKTTNFFNTLRFLAFIEERRRTEAEEGTREGWVRRELDILDERS